MELKRLQDSSFGAAIAQLRTAMLELPQAHTPIRHYFAPGVYGREAFIPACTAVIGQCHKVGSLNVLFEGQMALIVGGEKQLVEAPLVFTSKPGMKIAYAVTDCRWLSIFGTDETDIEKLEEMVTERDPELENAKTKASQLLLAEHRVNIEDFEGLEFPLHGASTEFVDTPCQWMTRIAFRSSLTHGRGVFAEWPFLDGQIIGPVAIQGHPTTIARHLNHAADPNAVLMSSENGSVFCVAKRDIRGFNAAQRGEEITINYRASIMPMRS